ncbi:PAS domain-containing protein [Natrononativus amylolyticus]|uniref:PAS domain-containing protein n=1 Tax=Natrononativus amylolyticus TaxID=2963434 RepID=UPI0020CC3453|nr:PAS domain-containing protein [Natrononativus amylolyticus]
MTNTDEIIFTVVSVLAEADGVPPEELPYTLAEYVDPSMIEALVSNDYDCELAFRVPGHEVTVTAAGEVTVDERSSRTGTDPQPALAERRALGTHLEQRRLQQFFDTLPCTVYQSRNEPGWPIEFISGNCRELTGYDPNAFIVGGITFGFDLIHPADRGRVAETVQAAVRNEDPFSVEYRIQTAEETEKWVREIGVGLFSEPDPIPFVGTLIDLADLESEQSVGRRLPTSSENGLFDDRRW